MPYIIDDCWSLIKSFLIHNIKIHGKHLKNCPHVKTYNEILKKIPKKSRPKSILGYTHRIGNLVTFPPSPFTFYKYMYYGIPTPGGQYDRLRIFEYSESFELPSCDFSLIHHCTDEYAVVAEW